MISPFATIYLALQKQIQNALPQIKFIALNSNQLQTDSRPALTFPFILIDFAEFSFQDLSDDVQTVMGYIDLLLGFKNSTAASSLSPTDVMQQSLIFLDTEWQLQNALQGWSPSVDMGSLSRVSTTTIANKQNMQLRKIRYSIAYTDYSAKPSKRKVKSGFGVGV
jgi:hypothetical protein